MTALPQCRVRRDLLIALSAGVLALASGAAQAGGITVSAAASLTDAFKDIATAFEESRPRTKVTLNFGASGQLLQQIAAGALVDVFASADLETMDRAAKQAVIVGESRVVFARNELVVAVPATSLVVLNRLADVGGPEMKRIAIGHPDSVPAGRYARDVLTTARLWPDLQDRLVFTQNVRQALDYVTRGEVDAAFVYRTDAIAAVNRAKIAFVTKTETPVLYPAAVVKGSANAEVAAAFVRFLRADAAQRILERYGFGRP
jgi:molybdate transport system substrate-binding protein